MVQEFFKFQTTCSRGMKISKRKIDDKKENVCSEVGKRWRRKKVNDFPNFFMPRMVAY